MGIKVVIAMMTNSAMDMSEYYLDCRSDIAGSYGIFVLFSNDTLYC